mmetsp:Transcript_49131/g.90033  ORF Transcript_49131/g.90033 Transcript_49131/m.90033 type:complete len:152 (+) Transcript_49131:266-721(+)
MRPVPWNRGIFDDTFPSNDNKKRCSKYGQIEYLPASVSGVLVRGQIKITKTMLLNIDSRFQATTLVQVRGYIRGSNTLFWNIRALNVLVGICKDSEERRATAIAVSMASPSKAVAGFHGHLETASWYGKSCPATNMGSHCRVCKLRNSLCT